MLSLQRSAGNRAVTRRLLTIQRHSGEKGKATDTDAPAAGARYTKHAGDLEVKIVKGICAANFTGTKRPQRGQTMEQYVIGTIDNALNAPDAHFHREQVDEIAKWIETSLKDGFWGKPRSQEFDDVVRDIGNLPGANKEWVAQLLAIKWPGKKPKIRAGGAQTEAFYTGVRPHTIVLDPTVTDPTNMLDAIMFECQNALQGEVLEKATGAAKGTQEFVSWEMYMAQLKETVKATDDRDLCVKLAVPTQEMTPVTYSDSITKVELPKNLTQRQKYALWNFKTAEWTRDQRIRVWTETPHGEGMASTAETYAKHPVKA